MKSKIGSQKSIKPQCNIGNRKYNGKNDHQDNYSEDIFNSQYDDILNMAVDQYDVRTSGEEQQIITRLAKDHKGAFLQQKHRIQSKTNSQTQLLLSNKKQVKPVRMFKDLIDLRKQNQNKRTIIREIQKKNQSLKSQYNSQLNKNQNIQEFLKAIEFTFKNNQSNQKANEILLKAQKNLKREEKQSKQYVSKMWKLPKNNYIKELNSYLEAQKMQKQKLIETYGQQKKINEILNKKADLNHQQIEMFNECQQQLASILELEIRDSQNTQEEYQKEKLIIKIHLVNKQISGSRKYIMKCEEQIKTKLLQKEGIQYEMEILRNRLKDNNKKLAKQKQKNLYEQVRIKKIQIKGQKKQLRDKSKTNQYIEKWTRQLKQQFEKLKQNHLHLKEQYEKQINKLSKQIEQWNRKYKAQLVEDQVFNKTNGAALKNQASIIGSSQKKKGGLVRHGNFYDKSRISFSLGKQNKITNMRDLKKITIDEINQIRKIIMFFILQQSQYSNHEQFIRKKIIKNSEILSYTQLKEAFMQLPILYKKSSQINIQYADRQYSQLSKLLRYIFEDNIQQSTPELWRSVQIYQSSPKITINSQLVFLILKNLLDSELTTENLPYCKEQLKIFMNKNYDIFRRNLWESSGKTTQFSILTLETVFRKQIVNQTTISMFVSYFQFQLWKNFSQIYLFPLLHFEMICELILGKRLIKDSIGAKKITVKSIYEENMKKRKTIQK